MYYKIRIDADEKTFEEIESLVKDFSIMYMGCYEEVNHKNPHTHWYVETEVKSFTIRNRIRQEVGKGRYSMKEVDERFPPEYLRYIVKDGSIVYSSNFDKKLVDKAIEEDKDIKEKIKKKKSERKTVLQELDDIVAHKQKEEHIDRWRILTIVLNYYKQTGKLIRQFAIVSQVQTLALKYDPDYSDILWANISKNL